MSGQGFKDIFKKGWHPEKEGTTFKGQMKSLVGRGDKNERMESFRQAAPLSSLRDPSSFGPPPRHVAIGGEGHVPTPPPSQAQTQPLARHGAGDSPNLSEDPSPARPFRTDTTGLSTSALLPPPARRDSAGGRVLPPSSCSPGSTPASPSPPKLPPRLPPRSNTPSASTTPESPERKPDLNQGAVKRLGAAGISVPGLGIGKGTDSTQPSELESRFAKFGLSNDARSNADVPTQGTTLAQKQAALKTAAAFRQDPRSVSMSDAKSAASTLNNFRQRHGAQLAALNESFGSNSKSPAAETQTGTHRVSGIASVASGLAFGKKPAPPPPPKKKPEVGALGAGRVGDAPPVPLATKPQI